MNTKTTVKCILQKAFEKLLKDIFEDDQKNTSLWMS